MHALPSAWRQVSYRGERERDRAALQAEYAHEWRRQAERSKENAERDRMLMLAGLHAEAAQLLERLGRVYDELEELEPSEGPGGLV